MLMNMVVIGHEKGKQLKQTKSVQRKHRCVGGGRKKKRAPGLLPEKAVQPCGKGRRKKKDKQEIQWRRSTESCRAEKCDVEF